MFTLPRYGRKDVLGRDLERSEGEVWCIISHNLGHIWKKKKGFAVAVGNHGPKEKQWFRNFP